LNVKQVIQIPGTSCFTQTVGLTRSMSATGN
jgi:hypothetical protein